MITREVSATLRRVAALRAFCVQFPHLPTSQERDRLQRFEELVASPGAATAADVDSLLAGWRVWWRSGQGSAISTMATKLPSDLVESDRRLATYVVAATDGAQVARAPAP